MSTRGCVAMVLAGGRGERLGGLTHYYSKPAIHFGGSQRIIDFTINNCCNTGIEPIGVLSQYFTTDLHDYIDAAYSDEQENGSIHMLVSKDAENAYRGTADAVYKNIRFIDRYKPENVLILSGDHIYKMDYGKMIAFHEETGASITVASTPVPILEASRFGILNAEKDGRVKEFEEKPLWPKSNLASMGIYVFKWSVLKKYLLADSISSQSQHDFGKNIIPGMVLAGERVFTYRFNGYWRDVGTVDSLWEANMDQIDDPTAYWLESGAWDLTGSCTSDSPIAMSRGAVIRNSIISEGCVISGRLDHSVLSDSVTVSVGAEIVNSVLMPGVYIGGNVKIYNAVVGTNAQIMDNTVIGTEYGSDYFLDHQVCTQGVSLIAPWMHLGEGMRFQNGSHIYKERLEQYENSKRETSRINYGGSLIRIPAPVHTEFMV